MNEVMEGNIERRMGGRKDMKINIRICVIIERQLGWEEEWLKEWDEISEGGCKVWEGKGKEMEWGKEGKEEWEVLLSRCPKAS